MLQYNSCRSQLCFVVKKSTFLLFVSHLIVLMNFINTAASVGEMDIVLDWQLSWQSFTVC